MPGLQTFTVQELGQFTREGSIPPGVDHWLFYVGRDDVHSVLKYIHSPIALSYFGNMFGYDDDELNGILWNKAKDPHIAFFETLDLSQSGGRHEAAILASDIAADPACFNAHFARITSSTIQISHTKGGVADGCVGFEGSTNWSASGEGTFVIGGKPGGPGYKAQNNTLMVFTDHATVMRFQAELISEHMAAHVSGGSLVTASATA